MKYHLVIAFLFFSVSLFSQQKGATPLKTQNSELKTVSTYAVVIGISDYQDPDIPDLRFADRDAEAFANFLRSPACGSLDGDHLKLLTNQSATAGRIAEALDALIEQAKEGDQVIIYFSGHGDVEGKKISQPGFLLAWDAPPRVYTGGGTYSLSYLQEIVTTLSVQNLAKVVVITDACHAGKLSGSQIGGAQLTAVNLAKQYVNEIKILSCQPNEYSLEGEQWGGGRGCFSYHLVEGLFGLADRNGDLTVTVGELDRYLEDHVTAEAAPQSQVPMLLGNKTERLATVGAAVLADLQKHKSRQVPVFKATEGRGFEDEVLAKVDTNIREMYRAFKLAVEEKRFLPAPSGAPAGNCAEDYYSQLTQVEALAPLRGMMKRNYAAALIDEGQQIFNRYLKGDSRGYDEINTIGETKPRRLADQAYRAAELLGEKHYFYPKLKAKALYLESFAVGELPISRDSARALDIKLMRRAVALDPVSPHIWLNLALVLPVDSVDFYIEKLKELAPNWPIWYADISRKHINNNPKRAIEFCQKAIELDSTYSPPYLIVGYHYLTNGRHAEAEEQFKKAIQLGSTEADVYTQLGYFYLEIRRFAEAEHQFKKAIPFDPTNAAYYHLACSQSLQNQIEKAYEYLEQALKSGYNIYDWMQEDSDLAPLREQKERWQALMKKYFPDQAKD